MAPLRWFDNIEIRRLAPMSAVIDALRECFSHHLTHIARQGHPVAGGEFLVMPAVDATAAGIKLILIQPANAGTDRPIIQGTYVLFDAALGCPVAVLDGAALTNLRTPAISAIATDVLARPDVVTLGIVGSGPQALGHVEAMRCVRPSLTEIVVASRTPANAQAVVEQILAEPALARTVSVQVGTYEQAGGCDVVCTATRSLEPLINRAMVRPGTHLNAVGSYRTDMRELATDLIAASTVYVDDIDAAHHEAGELALADADPEGGWHWNRVAGDLAQLVSGKLTRRSREEITMFKSVGLAVQDLAVARLVAARDELL